MGYIYKLTCIPSGKSYIGQTYRDVVIRVIREHLHKPSPDCRHLFNAVKKHGADNFTYEILHDGIIPELLDTFEIEAIKSHNTLAPNGFNLTTGGRGGKLSDETRARMSEAHKGKKLSLESIRKMSEAQKGRKLSLEHRKRLSESGKGRKHSKETREKMSQAHIGKPSPNKGRKLTDEHRRKISESGKGRKHSKEALKKMSEVQKANNPKGMLGKTQSIKTRRKISCSQLSEDHNKVHAVYIELPSTLSLNQKRKILRDHFPSISSDTIYEWVRKWSSDKWINLWDSER